MTADSHSANHLINQSVVRFSSGTSTSHSYSNIVDTPVVGPIITVLKKANTHLAVLGQIITYTLTIANKGNLDAQVTLFDNMPEGTTFIPNSVIVDNTPLPMAKPDTGIPLGNVHVCQTIEVTFQVIVLEIPASRCLKNQATTVYYFHTPGGRDVSGSSKSNTVIIPFKETKIRFTKHASTTSTYVGDTVTFYFTIRNEEACPVHHPFFKDELPAGVAFVPGSVKIDQVSYPSANPNVGIKLGEMPAHSEVCLQFQVTIMHVPTSHCIVNSAVLTYSNEVDKGKIVSNTISIHVYDPALTVVESVLEPQATLGDTLTYDITITNHGNIATEVQLSDFIPQGSFYVVGSLTVDGVPYSQKILPSSIPLGTLQPNKSFLVKFQVTVNSFAISLDQRLLISQAHVLFTYQLPDGRIVSNQMLANLVGVELLLPIMDVLLSATPRHAEPGTIIHYQILVANTGNLAANQVNVLDWISQLNTLIPGSLRINGILIQEVNVKQPLFLGNLQPRSTSEITYDASIIHHSNARRLTLQVPATFEYQVNVPVHKGTVLSNVIVIRIEHSEE
ncbi:hypothetical protein PAECIP111891_01497 [Paenibacillus allorhizoplanae]|uniref:DUF11 domain-containing protein n=1 Tax=Paenibacillus allorhizoplanae TaxID=2905648 RepID=A0ABN8G4T0_9BACL|nr:hypothetical protein [Paenibacillus allorhizoplanae]CAH1200136.1 hypothetical protein PAECIP111891_01497 [Paenibacillus allorhizoplanae]